MEKRVFVASFGIAIIAFGLSAASLTSLCDFGGCTEAHLYRMMGMHFAVIGCAYFSALAAILWFGRSHPLVLFLYGVGVAAGVGAEMLFVVFQHAIIKAWCPVCLAIAACVLALMLLKTYQYIRIRERRDYMRGRFWGKVAAYGAAVVIGFLVSVAGISRPDAATTIDPFLGKQDSKVEIYVFTDWFCPGCIKAEPAIEAAFPEMTSKARVLFVEKTIHPQSLNFVPYNISFLAFNKDRYVQARHALHGLAAKTTAPTPDQVQAAVAPIGIKYRTVDFVEIVKTLQLYETAIRAQGVHTTPTVAIRNSASKKTVTLSGSRDITADSIKAAIKSVQE